MRRTYSYTEAVQILGGKDHPVVAAVDELLGGALLAGSAEMRQLLRCLDTQPELLPLFRELLATAADNCRELSRYDRTKRLHAAHSVLVMTAFFESVQDLGLTRRSADSGFHISALRPFGLPLPLPSASLLHRQNLMEISSCYHRLVSDTFKITPSLWSLDTMEASRIRDRIDELPMRANARYEVLFEQLVADFPEMAFWCSVADHRAVCAALARLEDALRETTTEVTADVRLAELAGVYAEALRRPLLKSSEGLRMPTLGETYVDPCYQLLTSDTLQTVPSMADSWRGLPERTDLHAYLAGHLTSPDAVAAPLLVLGDPGSGKSVLTEMLAARLPASDFAVVRIELRSTPVDAGLVRQVEHGLHRLLDEPVSWAEFSRRTGGALPVVILDGLDELMQATGVSQSRYLTVVAEFQEKLLAKNRPAVFVVTSRLSVCAGLELPPLAHIVRLLPFSDDQVRQWLTVWNAVNPPLPAEVALSYRDLACQPLLLLMLALYNALDGALQQTDVQMSRGLLYEQLLDRFARREVTKSGSHRTGAHVQDDVDTELERLAVVALAMFTRGVQHVAEHEVTADLTSLAAMESPHRLSGTRTPLSAGEVVLGRFFFVQKSEAVREDRTILRTYEFLHATFGEYLVARYVWERLEDLRREDAARARRRSTVDDTELYSVLSFTALTTSRPVLDFLGEFAQRSGSEALFGLVVRVLGARDERRLSRGGYEPQSLPDSVRDATYAVNLVVLALAMRDKVHAADLGMSLEDWQRVALFWKSRLPSNEWASIVRCLWVERDDQHQFAVSLTSRVRDAQAEWLVMSEPYVTQDDVAVTLRDTLAPLAERHTMTVTAALIELAATPIDRCLPALLRLESPRIPKAVLVKQVCARIGRGGDDLAILEKFGETVQRVDVEALDAWLRLHERGFEFPRDRNYADVAEFLQQFYIGSLAIGRPDLLRRARAAAAELGLEWPPSRRRR